MLNVHRTSLRVAGAFLCLTVIIMIPGAVAGQAAHDATSGPLYDELARMDSLLFENAFVTCDAERFRSFFTEDVEFYHDIAGPSYGAGVRMLKGCPRDDGVRRVLVPGSLEVYPMADFGAIQMGLHRFVEDGVDTVTIARFAHLWHHENGTWRIARVLSYDHRPEDR